MFLSLHDHQESQASVTARRVASSLGKTVTELEASERGRREVCVFIWRTEGEISGLLCDVFSGFGQQQTQGKREREREMSGTDRGVDKRCYVPGLREGVPAAEAETRDTVQSEPRLMGICKSGKRSAT